MRCRFDFGAVAIAIREFLTQQRIDEKKRYECPQKTPTISFQMG